jgi:hypothetical protein
MHNNRRIWTPADGTVSKITVIGVIPRTSAILATRQLAIPVAVVKGQNDQVDQTFYIPKVTNDGAKANATDVGAFARAQGLVQTGDNPLEWEISAERRMQNLQTQLVGFDKAFNVAASTLARGMPGIPATVLPSVRRSALQPNT